MLVIFTVWIDFTLARSMDWFKNSISFNLKMWASFDFYFIIVTLIVVEI